MMISVQGYVRGRHRKLLLAVFLGFVMLFSTTACEIPGFSDDESPQSTPVVDQPQDTQQEPDDSQEQDARDDVDEPQDDAVHELPDEAFQLEDAEGAEQLADPIRIVEGGLREPRTLNPVLVDDPLSEELSKLIFSGLTRLNPDTGEPEPDLASSWDIDDEGTTYTFHIRDGVTWHDGQQFTAQDVEFTFELMMDQRTRSPRLSRIVERVAAVEAIGPQTVEFRLIAPYAPLPGTIATFGIVPQHLLNNVLPEELVAHPFGINNATGTGPFQFLHWDRGERIVVEASPDQHGNAPSFDQYEYRVLPDAQTLLDELETGDTDWARISADLYDDANALSDVEAVSISSYAMVSVVLQLDPGTTTTFAQVELRRALLHALDREQMIDAIWNGTAEVAHSTIPPSSWAAAEPETRYEFDPERAGALLDEAGWLMGEDGRRQRDGVPLEFTLVVNGDNPIRRSLGEWLIEQWRNIGVEANVAFETWGNVRERITTTRDFESLVLGYRWEIDPDQHAMWSSDSIADAFNLGSYVNRDVDRLLNEALQTRDQEIRASRYAEVQELVLQDLPVLPLAFPDQLVAMGPRLHEQEQSAILLRNRSMVAGWVPVIDDAGEDDADG